MTTKKLSPERKKYLDQIVLVWNDLTQYSTHDAVSQKLNLPKPSVRRLIKDEEIGLAEHGLRDAQALAHALAVGADLAVDGGAEVGDFEHLIEIGLLVAAAGSPPVEIEVLATGEVRQEPGALDEGPDPREDR